MSWGKGIGFGVVFFYLEFATLCVLKILLLAHFFLDLSCPSYVPRDPFSASRLALG